MDSGAVVELISRNLLQDPVLYGQFCDRMFPEMEEAGIIIRTARIRVVKAAFPLRKKCQTSYMLFTIIHRLVIRQLNRIILFNNYSLI